MLRLAVRDEYRRRSKSSRDYPKKKRADSPPGPPQIIKATAAQIRLARQVKITKSKGLTA